MIDYSSLFLFLFFKVSLHLAIANVSSSKSFVIVEPAAISTRLPIFTGAIRLVLHPINDSSPITVLCLDVYKRQQAAMSRACGFSLAIKAPNFRCGPLEGPLPVSYTHLDVYKRQALFKECTMVSRMVT